MLTTLVEHLLEIRLRAVPHRPGAHRLLRSGRQAQRELEAEELVAGGTSVLANDTSRTI